MSVKELRREATGADLAAVVRLTDDDLAERMADAVVDLILDTTESRALGWATEKTAEALAWTASWVWQTATRGDRPQSATVIQIIIGGRSSGEGLAEIFQYVSRGALTTDEARTVAVLAASGMLPRRAAWSEL